MDENTKNTRVEMEIKSHEAEMMEKARLKKEAEENERLFKLWEKDFYDKYAKTKDMHNADFKSIAVGFFIAHGCDIQKSLSLYEYCVNKKNLLF